MYDGLQSLSCQLTQIPYTALQSTHTPVYTHTRLTALFPGLPGWAGTRKVKPIWILLKQETVSSSGIRWACASLHLTPDRKPCQQLTTQFFTGRMPFLPPNQQRQSTEGTQSTLQSTGSRKFTSS